MNFLFLELDYLAPFFSDAYTRLKSLSYCFLLMSYLTSQKQTKDLYDGSIREWKYEAFVFRSRTERARFDVKAPWLTKGQMASDNSTSR